MRMRISERWLFITLTILLTVSLVAVSCDEEETSSEGTYTLTNTQQDVDYILDWETIVAECPELAGHEVLGGFLERGDSVEIAPGETVSLPADSPALWSSRRLVREGDSVTSGFRSFTVGVSYADSDTAVQQLVSEYQQMGCEVQEGEITTGFVEETSSTGENEYTQVAAFAAGNRLVVDFLVIWDDTKEPFASKSDIEKFIDLMKERLPDIRY